MMLKKPNFLQLSRLKCQQFFICIFCCLFFASNLFGQRIVSGKNVDSLFQKLETTSKDSVKLDVLITLAIGYRLVQKDSAMMFISQAEDLLKDVENKQAEAKLYALQSRVKTGERLLEEAESYAKKALEIGQEIKDTISIITAYHQLIGIYNRTGNLEQSKIYLEKVLSYSECFEDADLKARSYLWAAGIYEREGDYERALENYMEAIEPAKESKSDNVLGVAILGCGMSSKSLGKWKAAEKYLLEVDELFKDNNNKFGRGHTNMKLGEVYTEQLRYSEAIQKYTVALNMYQEVGMKNFEAASLKAIGILYKDLLKYDLTIKHFKEAEAIYAEAGGNLEGQSVINYQLGLVYCNIDSLDLAEAHFNIADSCLKINPINLEIAKISSGRGKLAAKRGQQQLSISYFKTALEYFEKAKMQEVISSTNLNIAQAYLALKNYDRAIAHANKANKIASLQELLDIKELIAYVLYKSYLGKNNYKKAVAYQEQYFEYRDSMSAVRSSQEVNLLLAEFENEKRETEVALLNKEKEIQQAEYEARIGKEVLVRWGLIVLSLSLLALGWVIVQSYNQKIKLNEKLLSKHDELSQQKILELRQKQKANLLEAMTSVEEKERFRMARELHDGIGGGLASIKLHLNMATKSYPSTAAVYTPITKEIDAIYREVRSISHNLTPPALSKISFNQLLNDYVSRIKLSSNLEIELNCFPMHSLNELDPKLQLNLYRILQESLNNVLKHSEAKSVHIDLTKLDEQVILFIEDDGIGFDMNNQKNGIGLNNIQSRVESLQGKFEIDAVMGRGTVINVEIPVHESVYSILESDELKAAG